MKTALLAHTRGVTLVEILVAVGIMAIISSAATAFFSNFILKNNTDLATATVVSVLRKAQLYSVNSKNNSVWGVCSNSGNIRLYTGSCASPVLKEDTSIPLWITVSGLNAVTFSKLRGEPSISLNITVSSNLKANTVALNPAGGLDVNY